MTRTAPLAVAVAVALALPLAARAAEHPIADAKQLKSVLKKVQPGDAIVLQDGTYADVKLDFFATGTADAPITLRAQTPGNVFVTGRSTVRVAGKHLVLSGLVFKDGGVASGQALSLRDGSDVGAEDCRVTECAFIDYNPPEKPEGNTQWLSMYGKNNRVDHCYFKGKTTPGPILVVWVEPGIVNAHRIDHNHFAGRPPLGTNGGETMRIGTSEVSMNDSRTVVEQNYFENCDGEAEIISSKSCGNVYRGNTFVRCAGALVLRHGNGNRVEGNFFFGLGKAGSGGIRLIGEDQVIVNNYLDGLLGTNFESAMPWVDGIPNSKPNEYFRIQRALVAYNTLVDCAQSLTFGVGHGARNRVDVSRDCTIANNLIVSTKGPLVRFSSQPERLTWIGNILGGAETGLPANQNGVTVANVTLTGGDNAMRRPDAASAVRGAAKGTFDAVTLDIDGQPRPALGGDVGCDQRSDAPIKNRPLTPADVGPAFMRAK